MSERPPHSFDGLPPGEDEEVARLLRAHGPVARVPDHELPPIKAAVRAAWRGQVHRTALRRRAAYAALAIAAAVLAAVGIAVLRPAPIAPPALTVAATLEAVIGDAAIGERSASAAPTRDLASGTSITTGDAGRTALRLAAGHSVRVDVASSVRIVSPRSLRLERGAVYVDTDPGAAGDAEGIEIETPFGRVTDLGTLFEVRLIAADGSADDPADAGALRVTVREGSVRLATVFGDYDATAGSELYLRSGGRLDREAAPTYGSSWSWVESVRPPLAIEGVRLSAFLDWASRESGRRWRFTEPERSERDGEVVLHGSIEGMTVEEALSTVLPSCGLRHRVVGGELLIESDPG
jgi:hypothetical protein